MIARLPNRIASNSTNDTPSYFADWFPTLCEAVGFEKPDNLDGESLWPVLTGTAKDIGARNPMVWVFPEYGGQVAVRIDNHKVVRQGLKTKKPGTWEVYDLSTDRSEKFNIAEKHPQIIEQAIAILRREVNDNSVFPLEIPEIK
jgi:arylsulfatase A-like enzyme